MTKGEAETMLSWHIDRARLNLAWRREYRWDMQGRAELENAIHWHLAEAHKYRNWLRWNEARTYAASGLSYAS